MDTTPNPEHTTNEHQSRPSWMMIAIIAAALIGAYVIAQVGPIAT